MFKFVAVVMMLAVANAAPAAEPNAAPHAGAAPGPAPGPAPAHQGGAHIAPQAPEAVQHEPINDQPAVAAASAAGPASEAGAQVQGVEPIAQSQPPAPIPTPKQLFIADLPLLKTPASTAKLSPVPASFVAPISPLAYAAPAAAVLTSYPAIAGLAALPASYTVEQHGYHIAY